MSRTRGVILAIFVLVVGAIGVAACGGDNDDAKTSATVTNQQQSSVTAASTEPAGEATTAAAAATTAAANPTQPPSGGGSDVGTACDLLTKAEVEEALDETVNVPDDGGTFDTPLPGGGTAAVSTCGWTSESFASSISLTFWNAPGLDQGIDGMIDLACGGHEEISGLGDRACWYDDQHVQIQAAKGAYFLDIFATMSGDATGVLTTLAGKAVDRLS